MKRRHSKCLTVLLALVPAFWVALPASAQRSLYWSAMAVKAHLDADGSLEVEERQDMVFTGDWNGGERIFRVASGQSLVLQDLTRLDPATGEAHPLSAGNLNGVDHFAWVSSNTLRWRSRLPSDPPFDHTPLTYVLRYKLSGILLQKGTSYLLDHDFAFPDRAGDIQRFTLDLSFDPVWRPLRPVQSHYEAGPLHPGASFVLTIPLAYEGSTAPAAVRRVVPASWRWGTLLLFLVGAVAMATPYLNRERDLGRFKDGPALSSVDRSWLEENLFDLRPEEAGAAWDESVGAPEVAALLARLVAEKRLKSNVVKKGLFKSTQELELELEAPLESFEPYERKLLEGLFFDGATKTSTSLVREHYKSTGFDPSKLIREPLEKRLAHLPVMRGRGPKLG
ncbi:MAG TPA: hypothetical protein VKA53_04180, partial [Thermoanaerobaculia bacterium]|nr:hypothetical protein [Thermoanaerobaculia bacterium]